MRNVKIVLSLFTLLSLVSISAAGYAPGTLKVEYDVGNHTNKTLLLIFTGEFFYHPKGVQIELDPKAHQAPAGVFAFPESAAGPTQHADMDVYYNNKLICHVIGTVSLDVQRGEFYISNGYVIVRQVDKKYTCIEGNKFERKLGVISVAIKEGQSTSK